MFDEILRSGGGGSSHPPPVQRGRLEGRFDEDDNHDISLDLRLAPPQAAEGPPRHLVLAPQAVRPPRPLVGPSPTMLQHWPPWMMANNRVNHMVNNGQRYLVLQPRVIWPVAAGGQSERPRLIVSPQIDPLPAPIYRNGEIASTRIRRRISQPEPNKREKPTIIEPPFRWATNLRARIHPLQTLIQRGITVISGDVQCKNCEQASQLRYNLTEKFTQVGHFIAWNRGYMLDRAPNRWLHPTLPKCTRCDHENSLKPVIANKKRNINWLFLLLGEMLGCCSLEQLKYFCKHTSNHRTGAKDRVLFLTYLGLCKQLDPNGPFHHR
ncbi:hypothetical protein QQ045_012391 [Rhodiola kirilowii]